MPRIIAIDYGTKRIGLAVGDAALRIAMPWDVLDARNDPAADAQTVWDHLRRSGDPVETLVVGLPLNMDGTEGPQAQLVRTFGQALAELSSRPVEYVDERLSSFHAEQKFRPPGKSRNQKSRKPNRPLDAVAAAVILDAYFRQE
ncbi:MAG: Holliday junction resolvase RuvX [Phycisphaerae bacterium]|nr:Holliday junction resolvase RuvX [Phycisphaerae bacterium]